MAKYGLLLSNEDGRTISTLTTSISYDDFNKYVYIKNISSSLFQITGANNSLLINNNGIIEKYNASLYPNSFVGTDGTKFILINNPSAVVGSCTGDLGGNYPNPIFKNISNVNAGVLPVARGGLGNSGIANIPQNSLIIANSQTTISSVNTANYNGVGEWVLGAVNNGSSWGLVPASAQAMDVNIQHFVGNGLDGATYTWNKTNSNHKWARVLLQGGGGGGGGSPGVSNAGSGGGGGGFTDIVIYIGNINAATIAIGEGGYGSDTSARASSGGDTSFSAGNLYLAARGGQGGAYNAAPGVGGVGLTFDGSSGGAIGTTNAATTSGAISRGASGGGGGGYSNTITPEPAGIAGVYVANTTPTLYSNGIYNRNIFGYNIDIGFGTGGSGGQYSANGYDGVFGGGGGGGGRFLAGFNPTRGGRGGSGWAVIISY